MKVYVDDDYEVYTEETINKEIIQRIEDGNYDGLYGYMADHFSESELFAILPSDVQSQFFEYLKKEILDNEFSIRYIDEPLPCDRCPFAK